MNEKTEMEERIKKAYAIANNSIYFYDSSDYITDLYEICMVLMPNQNEEVIGKVFITE